MLDDVRLTRLLRRCQQLPGQALFQYRDDDGALQPVGSSQVNDYLHEAMGEAFTAKDFRTWGGTLLAFQCLAMTPPPGGERVSERAFAATRNAVIAEVAHALGNTPAVCRKAYVDPSVFEGWRSGELQRMAAAAGPAGARGARQWEQATLKFLRRAHRRA